MIFKQMTDDQLRIIVDLANKEHAPRSQEWGAFLAEKIIDHFLDQMVDHMFASNVDSFGILWGDKKPATGGFLSVLKQHPKSPLNPRGHH